MNSSSDEESTSGFSSSSSCSFSPRSMDFVPPLNDINSHPLLETRAPAYTHSTVRRAFIVWLRCGQRNEFRDVCNYYHRLEALENQLSARKRVLSRHHELSLFVSQPPSSRYQQELFPHLYSSPTPESQFFSQTYMQNYQIIAEHVKPEDLKDDFKILKPTRITPQDIFDASQVFKSPVDNEDLKAKVEVDGTSKLIGRIIQKDINNIIEEVPEIIQKTCKDDKLSGTTKQDILETSQMIKNYCKDQKVPLRNFLEQFKEYATRCELNNTVNNVGLYIKRKMIQSELTLGVLAHRARNKSPKTALVTETLTKDDNETQSKLLASISKLQVQSDNKDISTVGKIDDETANIEKPVSLNDDFISFDDDAAKDKTDKAIKVLRGETELKSNAGFSSSHSIDKHYTLICRKI